MGLFSRRDNSEAALADMRAAIDELRTALSERADTADTGDAELRDQVAAAQAEQARLEDLVTALKSELTDTTASLGVIETRLTPAVDELDARLRTIDERLSTPMTPPPPIPPPVPPPSSPVSTSADVEALNTHLARLDERLAAVDRRVTVVSTELANQLAEMSADIEALDEAARTTQDVGGEPEAAAPGIDPELLDELRDAQVRLANEQARYQIAFRDDLARLVEQLSRRR